VAEAAESNDVVKCCSSQASKENLIKALLSYMISSNAVISSQQARQSRCRYGLMFEDTAADRSGGQVEDIVRKAGKGCHSPLCVGTWLTGVCQLFMTDVASFERTGRQKIEDRWAVVR